MATCRAASAAPAHPAPNGGGDCRCASEGSKFNHARLVAGSRRRARTSQLWKVVLRLSDAAALSVAARSLFLAEAECLRPFGTSASSWVVRSRNRLTQDRQAAWGILSNEKMTRSVPAAQNSLRDESAGILRTLRHSLSSAIVYARSPSRSAFKALFLTAVFL